jgi:hypothetical protein
VPARYALRPRMGPAPRRTRPWKCSSPTCATPERAPRGTRGPGHPRWYTRSQRAARPQPFRLTGPGKWAGGRDTERRPRPA